MVSFDIVQIANKGEIGAENTVVGYTVKTKQLP